MRAGNEIPYLKIVKKKKPFLDNMRSLSVKEKHNRSAVSEILRYRQNKLFTLYRRIFNHPVHSKPTHTTKSLVFKK